MSPILVTVPVLYADNLISVSPCGVARAKPNLFVFHTAVQGCPGQSRSGHPDLTNFEGLSRDYIPFSVQGFHAS